MVAAAIALVTAGLARGQTTETMLTLSTFAGKASPGSDDGSAATARFYHPAGLAIDASHNLYVADTGNATVRKISAGNVTTLAGSIGAWGLVDGTGSAASFGIILGTAVDASGNVYVADPIQHTIRKITPAGVVSTLSLDSAFPAVCDPTGVAVNSDGSIVYFTDRGNNLVRQRTADGAVTIVAGDVLMRAGNADGTGTAAQFWEPSGLARDASGNLFVADARNHMVRKIAPGGVVTTVAGAANVADSIDGAGSVARFFYPKAVAVDAAGNLYVVDTGNHTIRKVDTSGTVSTLAGLAGQTGTSDGTGSAAAFDFPAAIAVDTDGTVYVTDSNNNCIRKITTGGNTTVHAGNAPGSVNGAAASARFRGPSAVAVDSTNQVYVADTKNSVIRKITSTGTVSVLAGSAGVVGATNGQGSAASFNFPESIVVDSSGNVFVADTGNNTIRKITSAGAVTTLAGTAGVAGSTDGTGAAALFSHPQGLGIDGSGNLYVADTYNNTIRKVTPAGVVTTVAGDPLAQGVGYADGTGSAAHFEHPMAVAVDAAGNLFVSDTGNFVIRKITPSGVVTTAYGSQGQSRVSDGVGTAAAFDRPRGLAFDSSGRLYVADTDGELIRLVGTDGSVSTLVGLTEAIGNTEGASYTARLSSPTGLAVGTDGTVYIADTGNDVIRKATLSTGQLPVITAQPGGTFVYVGGAAATFSITATSVSGAVNYRWQVQPHWGEWTDITDNAMYQGSHAATLKVVGYTEANNSEMYRCIIDNGFVATVVSNSVQFYVAPAFSPVVVWSDPIDYAYRYTVSTFSGQPSPGGYMPLAWGASWGDTDGSATTASFHGPSAIAMDLSGVLFVADTVGGTIRKVATDGSVTTFAGLSSSAGGNWGNVDGLGTAARFAGPQALAFDRTGILYVADTENGCIRKIATDGTVTTLKNASGTVITFGRPRGLAFDPAGNLYVSDSANFTVNKVSPSGVVTVVAGQSGVSGTADGAGSSALFLGPAGLCVDALGNIYVADTAASTIRKIFPDGTVTTLAGSAGVVGTSDGLGTAARFNAPTSLAVDRRGIIFVADTWNHAIRQITPDGVVLTIAGIVPTSTDRGWGANDGVGKAARFIGPCGLVANANGDLFIADTGDGVVRKATFHMPLVGESVTFSANFGGDPGTQLWQVKMPGSAWTNLTDGNGYSGSTAKTLTVTVGSALNGAQYRCVATRYDNASATTNAATLAVGSAPQITLNPANQTVQTGQTATFSASATGVPAAFAFRWQRKSGVGSWLDLQDSALVVGSGSPTLALTTASISENGDQLRCVVSNATSPDATSTAATLTVGSGSAAQVAAPTFSPAAGSFNAAQSVTISSATSGASIRYTTTGVAPTSSTGTVYAGPVSVGSTTTLRAIAYKSAMTDSTVSTATFTINLADSTAPSVPSSLNGSAASPTGIQLTWTASTDNVAVSGYRIYRNGSFTLIGTTGATTLSFSDTGLTASTTYAYAVSAIDAAGNESNRSSSVNVTTQASGSVISNVTTFAELSSALTTANANPAATTTITLASGTYPLTTSLPTLAVNNLTLRGPSSGTPAVLDATGLSSGPILNVTADQVTISKLSLKNAAAHAIVIQPGADNGLIADNAFSGAAVAAIDAQGGTNWTVTANTFHGIAGSTATAEPAIHFYGGANGTVITNNLFLNCDRAITLGNGAASTHIGGQIQNNFIADNRTTGSYPGPGISLESATGAQVDNNSLYLAGTYANAIEYRYVTTGSLIRNNLTNKLIVELNGGMATLTTNSTAAQSSWFTDPTASDLHLKKSMQVLQLLVSPLISRGLPTDRCRL
ncbi:MAG: chitobiase/beta-hexosaminidase C-terminal domain-containing protein [Verrucomicrobia bacterium]|nr:chitobiase/beta-hexosaminidase C-terminal domain-containing protein [Verrucomicrobiota bacterium]